VNEQVVLIPKGEVEQLIKQIDDGQDYVVRIRSAGNYVLGEKHVEVFADAALNQVASSGSGDSTNPALMTVELEQESNLLGASKFRAPTCWYSQIKFRSETVASKPDSLYGETEAVQSSSGAQSRRSRNHTQLDPSES